MSFCNSCRSVLSLFLGCSLLTVAVGCRDDGSESKTYALLINGGSKPASNYLSHFHHLQDMVQLLEERGFPRENIHVFSADGEESELDLSVRDAKPETFWLIEGTEVGKRLRPRTALTDTKWDGMTMRPARKEALSKWFRSARRMLKRGDRLFIFVTDHGSGNPKDADNGSISLWQEDLSVQELKGYLDQLPRKVQTVMVMSQCYSGTFASSVIDGKLDTTGDACGFFSTTRDLRAYGCYPEGRDRDRLGHAFHFIDALGRNDSTANAHVEVLVTDDSPDVPLRTSDVYLERVVESEAGRQGIEVEKLVDSLLATAWEDRAAWETEVRLLDRLGDAYGAFSPRSLAEIEDYLDDLAEIIKQMKTYADRWKSALRDVKTEAMNSFLDAHPGWEEILDEKKLNSLSADERAVIASDLLPEIESHVRSHPVLWDRLKDLRYRAELGSKSSWRLNVRRGALLRMRTILVGVAGQVLLADGSGTSREQSRRASYRGTYEDLQTCEDLVPGELAPEKQIAWMPRRLYPPLSDEIRLLEELLPSWLGVRFGDVPDKLMEDFELKPGATIIEAVYPDSPAFEAGLQAGDIVLGPPDQFFSAPGQLREWAMTSSRNLPLHLVVLRPGLKPDDDREYDATIVLQPYPQEWPDLPSPTEIGSIAPALPENFEVVDSSHALPVLAGHTHLLYFWATWCGPCKRAVPELLAFAEAKGIPILAISDEKPEKVEQFLDKNSKPFFDHVVVDQLRKSFITYGVSGTPTIVLVDEEGIVQHRQVGYTPANGLGIDGWNWSGGS